MKSTLAAPPSRPSAQGGYMLSKDLPTPPVPSGCNLRGLPYYPLNYQRLFSSSFHRLATGDEWKAGLCLWANSWNELPSGSLPSDDRELCALAELGRDMRTWNKVKDMALHGWVPHSDGRLYHPVVTEVTLNAWGQREANRHRTQAALQARQMRQRDVERYVEGNVDRNVDRNVHQVKVKEEVEEIPPLNPSEPIGSAVLPTPPPNASPLRGSRLQQEIVDLPSDWANSAQAARLRAGLPELDLSLEFEKFRNHWLSKPGKDGRKLDWRRTWVNWALSASPPRNGGGNGTPMANLFEGAWRAANALDERERREQAGDSGAGGSPPHALLGRD